MILLIKLILAHFLGDFLLQPKSWVEEKEIKKASSPKLYLHIFIHGLLIILVLWSFDYWLLALLIMFSHGIIDIIKLYSQKEATKPHWFLIDQALHFISIFILWYLWFNPVINLTEWIESPSIWIYAVALIFLTLVSGIIMEIMMSNWSEILTDSNDEFLSNAGKYIGMLERLFVFTFIVTGNWAAIGFLLASKSVYRFPNLKESKNRNLTEYILIGTLLSFGIAIATSIAVLKLLEMV